MMSRRGPDGCPWCTCGLCLGRMPLLYSFLGLSYHRVRAADRETAGPARRQPFAHGGSCCRAWTVTGCLTHPPLKTEDPCGRGEGRRRWRTLDLGTIRAVVEADAPRVTCREHGVVVASVPWARHGAGHTYAFDESVAWLATQSSKSTVTALMRVAPGRTSGTVRQFSTCSVRTGAPGSPT